MNDLSLETINKIKIACLRDDIVMKSFTSSNFSDKYWWH